MALAVPRYADYRDAVGRCRVLVVGDVMLDRYWFGEVDRISPEAPVPVVKVVRTEERPGGAANVARNVAALRAHASLLSVIGDDEAGAHRSRGCSPPRASARRSTAIRRCRRPSSCA